MTDAETREEICRRLIEGESLRAICATDGMPGKSTVCRWLAADGEFREQYARARELQAETLADEILDIANTPVIGQKVTTKADGSVETVEGDMIDHRRLQVDARKWVASKLLPKKYGEAALIKHADSDGNRLANVDDSSRLAQLAALVASVSIRAGKALSDDR
jgi:hypothetical protein